MSKPQSSGPPPATYFNKGRLEAFSDGVFAIAITLLILDVRLPQLPPGKDPLDLSTFTSDVLPKMTPTLISYILSFIMVGIYWVAHHSAFFLFVGGVDRNLVWLNNALLLGIGFIPFSASVLGEHLDKPLAQVIYGTNLLVIGGLLQLTITYVVRTPYVRTPNLNRHALSLSRRRGIFALFAYALAMLIAQFQPMVSIAFFFVVPAFYLLPSRFDWIWELGHHHEALIEPEEKQVGNVEL